MPERPRFASESLWLPAAVGLLLAFIVAGGALALARAGLEATIPVLQRSHEQLADAIGRSLAERLEHALAHGIPLDRLHGVDRHFDAIAESTPSVAALALAAPGGTPLAVGGRAERAGDAVFTHPVRRNGVVVAEVRAFVSPPDIGALRRRLAVSLAAAAGLCGLAGGALTSGLMLRRLRAARAALRGEMRRPGSRSRDDAAAATASGAVRRAFAAIRAEAAPLQRARAALRDAVATVRAIDFDGSLTRRMDAVLAEMRDHAGRALRVADPDAGAAEIRTAADRVRDGWRGGRETSAWVATAALALGAAALPFVSNFAVDREWDVLGPPWWPALPMLAEGLCMAIGAFAARAFASDGGRIAGFAVAAALCLAAVGTGAVYVVRDYETALALRAVAGAGLGLALGRLTMGAPAGARSSRLGDGGRRDDLRAALPTWVLAAGVMGPVLGGLLGEALGRRLALLTLGSGIALAALATAATLRLPPVAAGRAAPGAGSGSVMAAAAIGLALGAVFWVWLPTGPADRAYLEAGLLAAAAGLGALAAGRSLGPRWGALAAAAGLVGAGAAPHLAAVGALDKVVQTAVLGGAFVLVGTGLRGVLDAAPDAPRALPAAGLGLAAGAALAGASNAFGVPAPWSAAAVLLAVASALPSRIARRRRRC